jgi:penicillin-binding protein 1A
MARVTGGSFPAEAWQLYMAAAHDTDNIPTIPGLEPHPVQVAEQKRIAAAMAQSATAELPLPPPAESVKDMSTATRQVLEQLSGLLKAAPILDSKDQARPGRAQAPARAPASSLASAADGSPSEGTQSAERDTAAAVPQ